MPEELKPNPKFFLGRELEEIPTLEGDDTFFIFKKSSDKKEFPANAPASTLAGFASSGMAIHRVQLEPKKDGSPYRLSDKVPFMGSTIDPFREDDFLFECWGVLQAHGWIDKNTSLSSEILDRVAKEFGAQLAKDAEQNIGEGWEWFIAEVAAAHFVEPLCRLWYAANMLSLYFAHQDDLATGYFWAEYNMRLEHETNSLRGAVTVDAASKGGVERSRAYEAKRFTILASMQRFVDKGHTAARAAELTAKDGVGTSSSANAKLWTRYRGK